jgi:hypothetical protein
MEAVVHDVTGSDQSVAVAGNTSTASVASLDDLLVMSEVAGNRLVELLGGGEISLSQALPGKQVACAWPC